MGIARLPSMAALGLCLLLAATPVVRAQAADPVVSDAKHIAILDHGTG